MARNPIIHNTGGINRYLDFVGQVPDFIKAEEDVVTFLQVLSDYLNNAYRNVSTVERFSFKFVSVDSNYGKISKEVNRLANLFKRSEARGCKVLFLSQPQGNQYNLTRPLFIEYIKYAGDLDSLSPNVATATLVNGDKVFVEFTQDEQSINTGMYVYDSTAYTLTLDKYSSSQDPFNNTPNKPISTEVTTYAPRMLEFDVSDISEVKARRAYESGSTIYYEIFFDIKISNIRDIKSVYSLQSDIDKDNELEDILIDYYGFVDPVPSSYEESFQINFAAGCDDFSWSGNKQGKGLFYFRELTRDESNGVSNVNRYIDPIYDVNTSIIPITNITSDASFIYITFAQDIVYLQEGDEFTLIDADVFSGNDYIVAAITDTKTIRVQNLSMPIISTYAGGKAIVRNLFYSRYIDDTNNYYQVINYNSFIGSSEFVEGDIICRVNDEYDSLSTTLDCVTGFTAAQSILHPNSIEGFNIGDYVTIRIPSVGTLPTGSLIEGDVYQIADLLSFKDANNTTGKNIMKLKDQTVTAAGTGSATIYKVNRYFDSSAVSIADNVLYLNDVTGLTVGDYIRFEGETTAITLPTPLTQSTVYKIEAIDTTDKSISLEGVTLTVAGSGNLDLIKMIPDKAARGKVGVVTVRAPLTSGWLYLDKFAGDLISSGRIINLSSGTAIPQVASIVSTSSPWINEVGTIYTKDDEYTYYAADGKSIVNYKVVKTHVLKSDTLPPNVNESLYSVNMQSFMKRKSKAEFNPYMFGMYRTIPLGFKEEIPYTLDTDEIGENLYIQKEQNLELIYGHDQREFVFNPRFAPKDSLIRNGFMEVIKSSLADDIVLGDVSDYLRANTTSNMILEYTEKQINLTVTSLTEVNYVVTAITSVPHGFDTGTSLIISGASDTGYNGEYIITVVSDTAFTYTVASTGLTDLLNMAGVATATYDNTIRQTITGISRTGVTATATTTTDHGYVVNELITISGATEPQYNGEFRITSIPTPTTFTYTVSGFASTPATTTTIIQSSYQPVDGDYITVMNQSNTAKNGIYIVSNGVWTLYDNSKVTVPVTLFTRQNMFDISDTNTEIASVLDRYYVKSLRNTSGRTVRVDLYEPHTYIVGSVVNIIGSIQSEYNGNFEVLSVPTSTSFTYQIQAGVSPLSPATGTIICQANGWYKYTITEIGWQKKTNYSAQYYTKNIAEIIGNGSSVSVNTITAHGLSVGDYAIITNTLNFNGVYKVISVPSTTDFTFYSAVSATETLTGSVANGFIINSNQNKDNVTSLFGEYNLTLDSGDVLALKDGLVIEIYDQFLSSENGRYRIQKNARWKRLDQRLVMKVDSIEIDAYENELYTGDIENEDPYVYRVYTDSEVDQFIDDNFNGHSPIYKIDYPFATNYQFVFEKIENMDTTESYHKQYDARYDKNSVVDTSDMKSTFTGIPDMGYPLVEKIERLVYLKDPNVIDFELIAYLARYMGYDLTTVSDDITTSPYYVTNEEQEMAVRKFIQTLPQYYALKSTDSGLDMLLLAFGMVGELVTLWTRQESPYSEFVRDYDLRSKQIAENTEGKMSNFVPTPYFDLKVDIESNFNPQLLSNDVTNIIKAVNAFKPINTVFNSIYLYLETKAKLRLRMSPMKSVAKFSASVGFDALIFDDEINNDCI